MDEAEKKVLKRRKVYLAESLVDLKKDMVRELVDDLVEEGLVTEEGRDQLKSERSQQTRVMKLVELLMLCPEEAAFHRFCCVLERYATWVARDMEADLKIEKGLVQVDERVMKEAAMLVHRKFGSSKRFSEGEKREIQELMAQKLQVSNEEWQRELERVQTQLATDRDTHAWKDRKSVLIANRLRDFAKENAARLTTHAHGMTTTRAALQLSVEQSGKAILTKLDENLAAVLSRFTNILTHREKIQREREYCMKLLKVDVEKSSLEDSLRNYIAARVKISSSSSSSSSSSIGCSGSGGTNTSTNSVSGSTINSATYHDDNALPPCDRSRPSTAFAGGGQGDAQRTVKRLNKVISDLEHEIDEREEKQQSMESALKEKDAEIARLRSLFKK